MGASSSNLSHDMSPETLDGLKSELLTTCEEILEKNPDNRCCKYVIKYLDTEEGKKLSNKGEFKINKKENQTQ
jgi:hypothetical protein